MKARTRVLLIFFAAVWVFSGLVGQAEATTDPVVVFDASDTGDASFNAGIREGIKTFEGFFETKVAWLAPASTKDQTQKGLKALVLQALKHGYDPIVCVGFPFTSVIAEIAPAHRDTFFVVIDSVVEGSNVQSIVFAEEQGSFLVGILAAMSSNSGVVGFVGGRDSLVIRNFACGFAQGVAYQSSKTKVLVKMVGTTNAAFHDPERGAKLTRQLASEGADVVFHAAGGTGNGVIAEAKKLGIKAIGVDRNQNGLAAGTVLTSMLKQVDVAVFTALAAAQGQRIKPGVVRLGLEKGAVGWALDENNRALISPAMKARMNEVRGAVISGAIKVHRYADDGRCPAYDFAPLPQ